MNWLILEPTKAKTFTLHLISIKFKLEDYSMKVKKMLRQLAWKNPLPLEVKWAEI